MALLTVYERGWGTRSINFVGNTIQRGNNSDDAVQVEKALEMGNTPREGEEHITVPTDEAIASSSEETKVADSPKKRTEFYEKKVSELTNTNNM